jgi:hypothetical protein
MRLGIVETQANTLDMTCRTIGRELEQTGVAIQDLPDDRNPVIFDPGSGTSEGILEARYVRLPSANIEVEIMLPVTRCPPMLRSGFGCR